MILEAVSLVDNQIGEFRQLLQLGLIANGHLVRRDDNGKVGVALELGVERSAEEAFPRRGGAVVAHDGVARQPLFNLADPVRQRGERSHHDERTRHAHGQQMRNQSDALNRFPQSHFWEKENREQGRKKMEG